ncbi:hypothetical protein HDU81_008385 [Chytriomyces hyalinus]|nr:hypothetical protein HDU81_008385 [Chytriomyces hyalinus]
MDRLKQRSLDLHNDIQSRGSIENLARVKSRSNLSRNGSLDCSKSLSLDAGSSLMNRQTSSRTPSKLDLHPSSQEPEQTPPPSPRERVSESFGANNTSHIDKRSNSVTSTTSFKSGKSIKKHNKSCKPLFPSPLHDALEPALGVGDSVKQNTEVIVLPSDNSQGEVKLQESSEGSGSSSLWSNEATTGGSVERFKVKF